MGNVFFWETLDTNEVRTSAFILHAEEYSFIKESPVVFSAVVPYQFINEREAIREALVRAKSEYGKAFQRLAGE